MITVSVVMIFFWLPSTASVRRGGTGQTEARMDFTGLLETQLSLFKWEVFWLKIFLMVLCWEIVDWVQLVSGIGTQISVLKITCKKVLVIIMVVSSADWLPTQSALHDTGMVQGRVQLDNGGVQPLSTVSVHQLPVDHGRLAVGVPVEVDHGDPLLVGSNHPGLDHLARHKLLQHEGGDVLIVCGVDVGKITFYGLNINMVNLETTDRQESLVFTWKGRERKSVLICLRLWTLILW